MKVGQGLVLQNLGLVVILRGGAANVDLPWMVVMGERVDASAGDSLDAVVVDVGALRPVAGALAVAVRRSVALCMAVAAASARLCTATPAPAAAANVAPLHAALKVDFPLDLDLEFIGLQLGGGLGAVEFGVEVFGVSLPLFVSPLRRPNPAAVFVYALDVRPLEVLLSGRGRSRRFFRIQT